MVKRYAIIDTEAGDDNQVTFIDGPVFSEEPTSRRTFLKDLASTLILAGFGTYNFALDSELGVDIFAYEFPQAPVDAICIILSGGRAPDGFMGSGSPVDFFNLQIQTRNRDARLAESNAETIRVLLDQADINGAWIQDTRSSPTSLSSPEEKRANMHRFSVDFSVAIERT